MLHQESKNFINRLLEKYPTAILIKKERASKHGDYRFFNDSKKHQITINGNLNTDAFLFVLIHEIAHRICFEKFRRKAQPHGKEWKSIFGELLKESIEKNLFPENIAELLLPFSNAPKSVVKLNSALHHELFRNKSISHSLVSDIEDGDLFTFRKKHFIRVEKKRTRILCRDLKTGKLYLFNPATPIDSTEKPQ